MATKPVVFPESFERDVQNRSFSRSIVYADHRVRKAFFEALPAGARIHSYMADYIVRDAANKCGYKVKKNRKLRSLVLIKPEFKEHKMDDHPLFDPNMLELEDSNESTEASDREK
jgi:hypothetical protein